MFYWHNTALACHKLANEYTEAHGEVKLEVALLLVIHFV